MTSAMLESLKRGRSFLNSYDAYHHWLYEGGNGNILKYVDGLCLSLGPGMTASAGMGVRVRGLLTYDERLDIEKRVISELKEIMYRYTL